MILAIAPLVQVANGRRVQAVRVALYGFAMVVAAASVGGALGWLGSHLYFAPVVELAVAALATVYGLHELSIVQVPVPQSPWRVPRRWLLWGPWISSLLFGLFLGAGVFTAIPFAGFYAMLGTWLVVGKPIYGLVIGSLYGLARSTPVLVAAQWDSRGRDLIRLTQRANEFAGIAHTIDGYLLFALAGALLGIVA
jgi:hypothetical protein